MAVWIFPKKIESIASISRKMMGVSSHTWIVSFMICGRDFPPRWWPSKMTIRITSPRKFYEIEGKREIENHAYQIMKVGFPAGFPFWPWLGVSQKKRTQPSSQRFFFGVTGGGWAQRQASADLVGGYRHVGEGWWDAGHFCWARGRAVRFFHDSSLKIIQVLRHLDDFPTELSDTLIAG